jgi:nucleotide-binding universal stress UspA family protein
MANTTDRRIHANPALAHQAAYVEPPGRAATSVSTKGLQGSDSSQPKGHARRLLVCLDGSPLSQACLPHAVSLAKTFASAVTLVRVMQSGRDHAGPSASDALDWEIARHEAQGYLAHLQRDVSEAVGRPVDVRLEQGRPAERIVELAREISADLILLGSRGDGGARVHTLGSTASQVLSAARTSLFIAPPSAVVRIEASPTRILVPLDGSLRSESILPAAARIARAYAAELLLVHVVQEPHSTALLPAADDMALARSLAARLVSGATHYLDRLRMQLAHEAPSVRTLVARHASEPECVLDLAKSEAADLIVLAAHGSGCATAHAFGRFTGFLLTHTAVPLLTLQDLQPSDTRAFDGPEAALSPPSPRASYAVDGV